MARWLKPAEMDTNQISPLSKRGREPSEIEAYTLSLAQAIRQNTTQTESQAHRLTPEQLAHVARSLAAASQANLNDPDTAKLFSEANILNYVTVDKDGNTILQLPGIQPQLLCSAPSALPVAERVAAIEASVPSSAPPSASYLVPPPPVPPSSELVSPAQPPSPVYSPEQTIVPSPVSDVGPPPGPVVVGPPQATTLRLLEQMSAASASGDPAAALAAAAAALAAHGMTAAPAAIPTVASKAPVASGKTPPAPSQPKPRYRIATKPDQSGVPSHVPMTGPAASAAPAVAPAVAPAAPAGATPIAGGTANTIVNSAHPAVAAMMADGASLEEAIAVVMESCGDSEQASIAPIALVPQNDTGFDIMIFSDSIHSDITEHLLYLGGQAGLVANQDSVSIGTFQQLDANAQAKSVLTVECATQQWYDFVLSARFVIGELAFAGNTLEDWLASVSAIPYFGKRYGINFGPFPFAPTWEHIKRYRSFMEHYGTPLNCIVYADRTVTISFALGNLPVPEYRRRISIVQAGKYLGMIHPVHSIRVLGINCCSFCPAIGEAECTAECAANRDNPLFKKSYNKIAAAAAARNKVAPEGVAPGELGGGRSAEARARRARPDERARMATGAIMQPK